MKAIRIGIVVLVSALVLASCASVAEGVVSSAMNGAASGASSGTVAAAAPAVVDFQSGEVLCSADSGMMSEANYYTAKILAPASPSTKNQAQVVFIADGKKSWVNYVVNSRKASKADFTVGATVFYLKGWDYDVISGDDYRKQGWALGNITSTDDLFKNRVEIDGSSYVIAYIRVPTDPIK
jgi:hypothetical protein